MSGSPGAPGALGAPGAPGAPNHELELCQLTNLIDKELQFQQTAKIS